ncbi:MAG: helix-turn-helix domain-containing protein [Propionibacteriaceae bacterium]|nr:helix-turn-helix domain-containing protein [Propionibacteriaceae bacterium]
MASPSLDNRLSTLDQVAEDLNLCRKTLDRAIARGELRAYKIGRAVRLRPHDVDKWIENYATRTVIRPRRQTLTAR